MKAENKNLLPVITSENDVYPYLKKINSIGETSLTANFAEIMFVAHPKVVKTNKRCAL